MQGAVVAGGVRDLRFIEPQPLHVDGLSLFDIGGIVEDLFGLVGQGGLQNAAFVGAVQGFNGLFEADGDEQADDDGGEVDEEVAPGVGWVVGWVDVEHGACSLIA
jgi:hypothetical protein